MNGLCSMYEVRLKIEFPNSRHISYDIDGIAHYPHPVATLHCTTLPRTDLFKFIDSFEDFSILHCNTEKKAYQVCNTFSTKRALPEIHETNHLPLQAYGTAQIKNKLYTHLKSQQ